MKKTILLLAIFTMAWTLLSVKRGPNRAPSNEFVQYDFYDDDKTNLIGNKVDSVYPADGFDFEELQKILQEKKFSKLDDLLDDLNQNQPDFMSRYTLVYDSKSLHESSKEFPRAIVYGENGKFIISFNGHPKQKGYDLLEVVQFNDKSKRFEFREIQFNDLGHLEPNESFRISSVNGPDNKCLQCHSNSRPIWESYPIWPGVYGADDDDPIGKSLRGPALLPPSKKVSLDWQNFASKGLNKGRYSSLKPMGLFGYQSSLGKRPNTELSVLLGNYNSKRIARILKESTNPSFRYAYLYPFRCQSYQNEDSGFSRLTKFYKPIFEQKNFEHQIYKISSLVNDLGYTKEKFVEQKVSMLLEDLEDQEKSKRLSAKMNFDDLIRFLISDQSLSYRGGYSVEVGPGILEVIALTSEFFPKIDTDTWGSSLYPGVHLYSTGVEFTEWLGDAIQNELFTKEEQKNLTVEMDKDKRNFCRNLERRFPDQLKSWNSKDKKER